MSTKHLDKKKLIQRFFIKTVISPKRFTDLKPPGISWPRIPLTQNYDENIKVLYAFVFIDKKRKNVDSYWLIVRIKTGS